METTFEVVVDLPDDIATEDAEQAIETAVNSLGKPFTVIAVRYQG